MIHGDLVITLDYVLIRETHSLDLKPFLHPNGGVIKLHQIGQSLYYELAVKRMLCNRVVPKPKDL